MGLGQRLCAASKLSSEGARLFAEPFRFHGCLIYRHNAVRSELFRGLGLDALLGAMDLWILVFAKARISKLLGVVIALFPHAMGAPRPEELDSAVPAQLASEFAASSIVVSAVFWICLGWLSARFSGMLMNSLTRGNRVASHDRTEGRWSSIMILRPDPQITILPLGMAAKFALRIRVLLLAFLLGLGMSLSFVQGSVMMAEMAFAADGAHHGPNDCDGCGGADQKDIDAGTCLPVCGASAQSLMPGKLVVPPSTSRAGFQVADLLLSGQSSTPDHGPPKTLTLG